MAGIQYVDVNMNDLMIPLKLLKKKYAKEIGEIENIYPIEWYFEVDCLKFWVANTTLAFSDLEKGSLKICFCLQHISDEINHKHSLTNRELLNIVTETFLEFLFLHELKHLNQFCNGMTKEDYKKAGKYKDNRFEKEANEYAANMIKSQSDQSYELLTFILNGGKFRRDNEMDWLRKLT